MSEISFKNIHKDNRGKIVCFYKDGREYTLLTTKKGYARGGCVHFFNMEYFVVLHGKVRYYIKYPESEGSMSKVYTEGENGFIPSTFPHYFIALEDSMTLEWGAEPEEKDMKDPQLRAVVDEINKKREKEITHFKELLSHVP